MTNHTHTPACKHLLGSISEYLDGELAADLCRELEQHLSTCPNCRVMVDTTRKAIFLVHAAEEQALPIPDDMRERLFHRLNLDAFLKTDQ